jgi:hypothetical protein
MNRQHTTLLIIPDSSNGSECLILPETHKYCRRLITSALARPLRIKQDWEILARTLITICQYAHAVADYVDGPFLRFHNRNFAQTMNPRNRININEPKSGSTIGGTEGLSI